MGVDSPDDNNLGGSSSSTKPRQRQKADIPDEIPQNLTNDGNSTDGQNNTTPNMGNRPDVMDDHDIAREHRKKRRKPWIVRCTRHPLFKAIPWTLVSFIPVYAIVFVHSEMLEKLGWGEWGVAYILNRIIAIWCCVQLIYNFICTSLLEPGYVVDNYIPPHDKEAGKYLLFPPKLKRVKREGENDESESDTNKDKGAVEMQDFLKEKQRIPLISAVWIRKRFFDEAECRVFHSKKKLFWGHFLGNRLLVILNYFWNL